jgi:hypothetical protein
VTVAQYLDREPHDNTMDTAMSAFDPVRQSGTPYHLRPSTPEELATHRRLLEKAEAMRREAIRAGRVAGPKFEAAVQRAA